MIICATDIRKIAENVGQIVNMVILIRVITKLTNASYII